MYNKKKILAIIPARGGSKGLPGKNILPLNGKPLIAWTIEQAIRSKFLDRFFVSTDSTKIAETAEQYGATIPFLRPAELAQDDSPTSDTIVHVIESFAKQGELYDYVALLEPTSPLRKQHDIDRAIQKLIDIPDADGLVSVGEVHTEHPMIVKKIDCYGCLVPYIDNIDKIYQRQQVDQAFFPYGVIYICKVNRYLQNQSFYEGKVVHYQIQRWQNFEIDDQLDFDLTEKIMQLKVGELNG